MIKKRRKRKSNQGNSFVVVVATISFLAVLVTALLVAVALCYRLKAYDINTRDNFYYLEQAMDEIYEGVGSIGMKHLNDAFDETAEVLVYYDTTQKTYVTMDNADANALMKATFLSKVKGDTRFSDSSIRDTLNSFITYKYDASTAPEGVQLSVGNTVWNSDGLTIKDVVLKRKAQYSTRTAKAGSNKMGATDFVQSITTDLTVGLPDVTIDFSLKDTISELYDFVLISDMGVEITGGTTKSNIIGSVYAAADFYNKNYEGSGTTDRTDLTMPMNNKVNSYTDAQLANCDGVKERSMYSGFYVSGARVSVVADKMIVPGSIASMNCASLEILGNSDENGVSGSKIWADSLILGGYSAKKSASSSDVIGATMDLKADAYVYDDLELNAASSAFSLDGNYYGYNYASTDNRTYSQEFISASSNRKFLGNVKINDGNYIGVDDNTGGALKGQAHYNSSSVVINGQKSKLDLSRTQSMYIAGQAYVELSKEATTKSYVAERNENDNIVSLNEIDGSNNTSTDRVNVDEYSYSKYDSEHAPDENYTELEDGRTSIQDYRTGEGLSIKSNQLAYIPPFNVHEADDGTLYVKWPKKILENNPYFYEMWDDLEKVPVIKTVRRELDENNQPVAREYYFYDFSKAKDTVTMNKYMEEYAALFQLNGAAHSTGDLATFYDITDYDLFKVECYNVDSTSIYSNSAISVVRKVETDIVANEDEIKRLVEVKSDSKKVNALTNVNANTFKAAKLPNLLGETSDTDVDDPQKVISDSSENDKKILYASKITSGLQKKYREMKMMLTDQSQEAEAITYAYGTTDSYITPINYYFDFSQLSGEQKIRDLQSGYYVFLSDGDIEVTTANTSGVTRADGRFRGIVICKGDVTFASDVKEFEGLIVAGGKVIVNDSINFVANSEIIKSILKECDESKYYQPASQPDDHSGVCDLFRHYTKEAQPDDSEDTKSYEHMKSVTAIQYEDMLSFQNWKKNVD